MEKIKSFLFAGDMIISTNNPKEFFLISRITEFDKVTRRTHKNQLHFYLQTASLWKSKLKNTTPCIIAPKKIGYLGINPTK